MTTFKVHSTRTVATSAAHVPGLCGRHRETADWKRELSFRRFYHRPVQDHKLYWLINLKLFQVNNLVCLSFEHTLSCKQPYHDIKLKISHGSEGSEVIY